MSTKVIKLILLYNGSLSESSAIYFIQQSMMLANMQEVGQRARSAQFHAIK